MFVYHEKVIEYCTSLISVRSVLHKMFYLRVLPKIISHQVRVRQFQLLWNANKRDIFMLFFNANRLIVDSLMYTSFLDDNAYIKWKIYFKNGNKRFFLFLSFFSLFRWPLIPYSCTQISLIGYKQKYKRELYLFSVVINNFDTSKQLNCLE